MRRHASGRPGLPKEAVMSCERPSNPAATGTPRRGFALVFAALTLVLAVVLAELATRLATAEQLAATYEVAEMKADYIAEAGLQMTAAWLTAMSNAEVDFDKALDPGLDTTCTFSGSQVSLAGTTSDDHLPPLPGGSASNDPGNAFIKMAYDDGALYVRIDDNSDDGHAGYSSTNTSAPRNYFPTATNNRAASCPEADSPEINALRDNPVRDRDKTVLVTVIGIYPGTTWSKARARKSYRLLMSVSRPPPGILAHGNITLNSNNNICGPQAGMHANGNITFNSGNCRCGEMGRGGTVSGTASTCATPAPCAVCSPPPATIHAGTIPVPNVDPRDSKYMNHFAFGANQCYFFLGANGVAYFWDDTRPAVSGEACNAFPNNGSVQVPRPCGAAGVLRTDSGGTYSTNDPYCHCWIPAFNAGPAQAGNPYSGTAVCDSVSGVCPYLTPAGVLPGNCASDCNSDSWRPTNTLLNYGTRCTGFAAVGVTSWHYDSSGTTLWSIGSNLADDEIPDAVFFVDGPANKRVELNSNIVTHAALVTPMMVEFNSNTEVRAPAWARNYLIVSGSTSNSLGSSSSCRLSSNSALEGMVVCKGNIYLASNTNLNGGILTQGNLELNSNATVTVDGTLDALGSSTVRPVVFADSAF